MQPNNRLDYNPREQVEKKWVCISIINFKVLQKTDVELKFFVTGPCLRKSQALLQWVSGQLSQHCVGFGVLHCQMCQRKSFIASKVLKCKILEVNSLNISLFHIDVKPARNTDTDELCVFLATFGHFLGTFLTQKYSMWNMKSDW